MQESPFLKENYFLIVQEHLDKVPDHRVQHIHSRGESISPGDYSNDGY